MKALRHFALLVLAPVFIVGASTPADDFYLVRLQAGKAEAATGRHYEAIEDFRIASFGFLDQPALLVEGLSRLALSQAAAGRNDDSDATLRKLVEIERRFDAWPQADLEPATRSALLALAGKRVGPEAVKVFSMPTPTPTAAPTAVPTAAPTAAPAAVPTPVATVAAAPRPTPLPVEAAAPIVGPPVPPPSAAILAESKALVTQGRYVENLRKLVGAVAASPNDRDLRKALLEAAALTKDWGTAVAQVEPLKPFRDGEEPWTFYAAVALNETGALAESRTLAERALPRLSRSPFVDYYARKILDQPSKR